MSNSKLWEMGPYNFYNDWGNGYISEFLSKNPEFNTKQFIEWVICRNRGDRDSGELQDVARHEVLRLAAEYAEYRWRFNRNLDGNEIKR